MDRQTLPYKAYVPHSKRRSTASIDFAVPSSAANVFTRPHARTHSLQSRAQTPDRFLTPPPVASSPSPSPQSRSSTPHQLPLLPSQLHLQQQQLQQSSTPSASSSTASTPVPGRTSYRPGFQPAGVYRDRTYDFAKLREGTGNNGGENNSRLHDVRILRRLDKLVNLHFPHPASEHATKNASLRLNTLPPSISDFMTRVRKTSGRLSSTSSLSSLSSLSPSASIKEEEQAIVKWVEDSSVNECYICNAPFSLTVRKHHCRLCGNVVCFLPPESSRRHRRCSAFIKYEWDDEHFPHSSRSSTTNNNSSPTNGHSEKEHTGQVIEIDVERAIAAGVPPGSVGQGGVRVCVSCISIILRQQLKTRSTPVPLCLRLHSALVNLQSEIEASLPRMQTLLLSPDTQSSPQNLLNARKSVLTRLASHDALARRIRDLPPSSSDEERLQRAMVLAAQAWLNEKMALLKGIGSFEDLQPQSRQSTPPITTSSQPQSQIPKNNANSSSQSSRSKPSKKELSSSKKKDKNVQQQDRDRAARLAVLLEQEKLVLGYFEEAKAKRQFEDSLSLQTSLDELRTEIENIKAES